MPKHQSRVRRPVNTKLPRRTLVAICVSALLITAFWWVNKNYEKLSLSSSDFIASAIGAEVSEILVDGVEYTDKQKLYAAIGLNKGGSLVGFDASKTRRQIESLNWVRLAMVERKLPSTIKVKIFEHKPIARMVTPDGVMVVDKEGYIIAEADARFASLPKIVGKKVASNAASLFSLLAQGPDFPVKLEYASFVGERRWDLGFTSGLVVKLPENNAAKALEILVELNNRRKVMEMNGGMVDLRIEDRIILRMPPENDGRGKLL